MEDRLWDEFKAFRPRSAEDLDVLASIVSAIVNNGDPQLDSIISHLVQSSPPGIFEWVIGCGEDWDFGLIWASTDGFSSCSPLLDLGTDKPLVLRNHLLESFHNSENRPTLLHQQVLDRLGRYLMRLPGEVTADPRLPQIYIKASKMSTILASVDASTGPSLASLGDQQRIQTTDAHISMEFCKKSLEVRLQFGIVVIF